jgi:hypothetical protein
MAHFVMIIENETIERHKEIEGDKDMCTAIP